MQKGNALRIPYLGSRKKVVTSGRLISRAVFPISPKI
jgi:hypothetical protein